jgi:sugar lactone lactonase YvrE
VNFSFVNGHTNLVQLDRRGSLWIGDDPGDGATNFTGRIWYISAGSLASLP